MEGKLKDIDAAARMSQRQLLGVLMVFVLLFVSVLWGYGLLDGGAYSNAVPMSVMPVVIIGVITTLGRREKDLDARALDAMRKDELRQASLNRAYRNGFFAMLVLQPLLGIALALSGYGTSIGIAGAVLMAAASVTLGAVTVLASLLWYDR